MGALDSAIMASVCTFVILVAFYYILTKKLREKIKYEMERANEAEKNSHLKEMENLENINKSSIANADALQSARVLSFEEGRKKGRSEGDLEFAAKIDELRNESVARVHFERNQASAEAVERVRAEYELQNKLFSVKISPYVNVTTDSGIINDSHYAKTGYQYQLLVNEIPAFSPHIVIEKEEQISKVNEDNVKKLTEYAIVLAESALKTYLGGVSQFANLAPAVVNLVKK